MSEFKATLLGMVLTLAIFGSIAGTIKSVFQQEANDVNTRYSTIVSEIDATE